MRLFRPGLLARWLYPEAIFRIRTTEKVLYLTFDDGPDRSSTPQLLEILKAHNIAALFFCNGKRAEINPDIMIKIREEGHLTGNHGYNHSDGWRTSSGDYISDVIRAANFTSDKLFRPPFGRLSLKQKQILLKSYKIILWDIMAYDFDPGFGIERSLRILKDKIRPGSIIVLHDTPSSCANIILDEFLDFAAASGYRFEVINKVDSDLTHHFL
jgi:peptidoglycan/xylan/chitin deacetylase (PgdA/CDA1 family)